MLTLEDYRARLAALLEADGASGGAAEVPPAAGPATQEVAVEAGRGRVLAADLLSPVSLPSLTNSQMDGYAVRSAEGGGNRPRRVLGVQAAGVPLGVEVGPGEALKIMTGAPLPPGADAVIPVEDALTSAEGGQTRVTFTREPRPGLFIRAEGEDLRAGERLIEAGTRLAPRHLAALAAAGIARVDVLPYPRVAVIATGAELVAPGRPLAPGMLYESNSMALSALLSDAGAAISARRHVGDDPRALATELDTVAADSDLILTSGGISAGDFEPVRQLLGDGWFGKVAMQPGGPQGYGVWRGTPIICLPGNPVSTVVSFEVLLRPLLHRHWRLERPQVGRAALGKAVESVPGKRQFLRGRRQGDVVWPVGGPGSHLIASLARADVLIDIPAEVDRVRAEESVDVWILR